jgi:hypothetical protein
VRAHLDYRSFQKLDPLVLTEYPGRDHLVVLLYADPAQPLRRYVLYLGNHGQILAQTGAGNQRGYRAKN